jgi:hypothetical protein
MKGILFAIVFTILGVAPQSLADYSARRFFTAAPINSFYTEDEMSEADRQSIVRSGFKLQEEFNCKKWGVAEETKSSLTLQYCGDSSVRIQVYPRASGGAVVAVESSRSSGRAVEISFFEVSREGDVITILPASALPSIGLNPLTENDFLEDKDHFSSSDNKGVPLSLSSVGSLSGSLNTWMDPRWSERNRAFDIELVWNGAQFERKRTPVRR